MMIELDSEFAQQIGFTSDKFDGWLWRDNDRVLISFIESKHPNQGHISKLFDAIEAQGYRIAVPTPIGKMIQILEQKGFVPHYEVDALIGTVEIWEKSN